MPNRYFHSEVQSVRSLEYNDCVFADIRINVILYNLSLTIRWFCVISRNLVRDRGLSPPQRCSRCILRPQLTSLKAFLKDSTATWRRIEKSWSANPTTSVILRPFHCGGIVSNQSLFFSKRFRLTMTKLGCPRGVMVKAMSYGIVVREFVLQSRYYVHFRANTLGKGMNPLILPPAMGK